MKFNDEIASNAIESSNLFAKCFATAYNNNSTLGTSSTKSSPQIPLLTSNYLTLIKFKDSQVLKVLKRLDRYKGAGADGIPSVFVANCASALAKPLAFIYNKSLATGIFPSIWKKALIIPLYKNGNKNLINNYRPISILLVFAKVFEKLLHPVLSWHFKQLLNVRQHGFAVARSTATNLTSFINDVSMELDRRSSIDAIYTDFSKAFDRVNHTVLLHKLSGYGFAEPLLSWCASYLSVRNSSVVVNGYSSDPFLIRSGVPQGSHLGPLLFNMFVNDIGDCFLNSSHYLFADDLKFFRPVNEFDDATLLQDDLDRLAVWCDCNDMTLNVSKYSSMRFTRKNGDTLDFAYTIKNCTLTRVYSIKDLGVTLDCKLQFNRHIDNICAGGFKSLGFILRNGRDL
ncbi:hypothetical protein O3G_MSEX014883 [Manduca sexta]|uniref:Reverse transcriptase domain-containing protein n=1 Tax=Manduca sexta TaxID=7130 RepID=A0A922CZ38_MANSE|nr:hypothetical protein O3G_MSEX014883 [Manduca sexta]